MKEKPSIYGAAKRQHVVRLARDAHEAILRGCKNTRAIAVAVSSSPYFIQWGEVQEVLGLDEKDLDFSS